MSLGLKICNRRLALDEASHVVVSGHSHQPAVFERDAVWFVNPGSAGPCRFKLPISAGEVLIEAGRAAPGITVLLGAA